MSAVVIGDDSRNGRGDTTGNIVQAAMALGSEAHERCLKEATHD